MNNITYQTRQLSFEDIKPKRLTKYIKILETLGNNQLTAREIKDRMGAREMNEVRPRITELCKEYHEMIACGKKIEKETNRTVAIFRRTTEQEKMELDNINHIPRIEGGNL